MTAKEQRDMFEIQVRELYGRVVWSHKTQEKCADILLSRHRWLKVSQIILSAMTTTGILFSVFGKNPTIGIISAAISAILFALNAYMKDYDLGQIAQKHSSAASDLWNIRESYLSLLIDLRVEKIDINEIVKKRDKLQEDLHKTYKGAPRTINKAYKEATKGLKVNEELTFTIGEIDNFLPEELRKSFQHKQ